MSRSENNPEDSKNQRNHERRIKMQVEFWQDVYGAGGGEWVGEQVKGAGHSFQLQGDIGHDAENCKNGHNGAEQ